MQAYAQRSDHLAIIAAFNGWLAARGACGRAGGGEFARRHWLSEQARWLGVVLAWMCARARA
jgi:hypothetical protein